MNTKNKLKVKESITNLAQLGVIPADELQLNLDVIHESILDQICTVFPLESPRQIISTLKMLYGSKHKSVDYTDKDVFEKQLLSGVGVVPLDDNGYPTDLVVIKDAVLTDNNQFIASYKNILPGTININDEIIDKLGKLVNKTDNTEVGTIDYIQGIFNFNNATNIKSLTYKFDIYNLMTNRNKVKFVKTFIEVFADLYQLDIDVATNLYKFKGLDIKKNIENIVPQVLTQQIDQYICDKYFDQAKLQVTGNWSAVSNWDAGVTRVPTHLLYSDLGAYISKCSGDYVKRHGVIPNVILVNPVSYSILSCSEKFVPNNEESTNQGTPKFVGYFNNAKVFLTNSNLDDSLSIVLTYKGDSDAQTAGVFCPYIPVNFRTVDGMEGNSMITTTNVYSIDGFSMINPDLVEGIVITDYE